MNSEDHTERKLARLQLMEWKHSLTVTAYQMRLLLQDPCRVPSVTQVCNHFVTWCHWIKATAAKAGHELLQPMLSVAEIMERHLEGIMAHWKEGLPTAIMGGLNSLFPATKRKAHVYRTTKNPLTML
jgi:hypothetical protein